MKSKLFFAVFFSFVVGNGAFACEAHSNAEKAKKENKTAATDVKKEETVVASREIKSLPPSSTTEKTAK